MNNSCSQLLILACTCLLSLAGAQAELRFLTPWEPVFVRPVGTTVIFDCTTNDPGATVELFKSIFTKLTVQPGKLTRDGDIFIIVSSTAKDAGMYTCKAVNQAGVSKQQSAALVIHSVKLPTYDHAPKIVQTRKIGESVQFRLIASVMIPSSIRWRRLLVVGGKDVYQPLTANHTITEKMLSGSSISSTLTLINLQVGDTGLYEAVATHDNNEHPQLFSVQVYAVQQPTIFKISPDSTTSKSKDKMLECVALGYPPPDLEWFKDGVKIPVCKKECSVVHYVQSDTHKSTNKSDGILKITGISYSDAGVYKCKANNSQGSGEATTRLTVQTKPYIYKYGSDQASVSYREGTWATVKCSVNRSEPSPKFTWLYKEFKGYAGNISGNSCEDLASAWLPLPSSITYSPPLNQSSKESTINIPPKIPPVDHAACYKCQATNEFGNDSFLTELHRYKLTQRDLLKIRPDKPQVLNAYGTLKLQCFLLLGSVDPYSVKWQRNDVDLDYKHDPRMLHNFTFMKRSADIFDSQAHSETTVTIQNLTVNDSGHYSCKVPGDSLNKTVDVVVNAIKEPETGEVPKLSWKVSGMANMTVYENNATSVKLQCVLEQGNPKPEFSWYKDNIPLHPNASGSAGCKFARDGWYFTENGKQEMVICGNPLKFETFSGRYTCQARNKVGMDEIHADLQILAAAQILEPEKTETSFSVFVKGVFNKTCQARGNPPPRVEWRKMLDGSSELIQGGTHLSTLLISSISQKDFGNYSCVARNWQTDQHYVQLVQRKEPIFLSWTMDGLQTGYFGGGTRFNCTTSEANATTSLWRYLHGPGSKGSMLVPDPKGKITKQGDVYTIGSLTIHSVGDYMCKAQIKLHGMIQEFQSKRISLYLIHDPKSSLKVRANPKCITIMSGENFNFSCETDIIRDVDRVLEWFIEDEDGVSVNKTLPKSHVHGYSDSKLMYSILMIKNAKRTNTVYGCRLTATFHLNLGKTMTYETYVRLNVKDFEPMNVTLAPESYLTEGQPFLLSCTVKAFPQPIIKWFKNGHKYKGPSSPDTRKYHTLNKWIGILKFTNPSFKRDVGNYTCVAANKLETKNATTKLIFLGKPTFAVATSRSYAVEGEDAKLECKITRGFPLPQFQWFYQPLICTTNVCQPDPSKWSLLPKKHMVYPSPGMAASFSQAIVKATKENAFYKCEATNSFGAKYTVIKLSTSEDPFQIEVKPTEATVNENATLKFSCIDINGKFDRLYWFKDGVNVTYTHYPRFKVETIRHDKSSKVVLSIVKAFLEDSGEYTCVASGSPRGVINKTAHLTVKELAAPEVNALPVPRVVENNSTWVILTCNVSANPTAEIRWFHDREPLYIDKDAYITKKESCKSKRSGIYHFTDDSEKKSLVICHPQNSQHTGNYTCRATNSEGVAERRIYLDVLAAPTLISEWKDKIAVKLESSFNFTCLAKGNPLPIVEWRRLRNGTQQPISSGIGKAGANIFVQSVGKEDIGLYFCVAWNNLGITSTTLELLQAKDEQVITHTGLERTTVYAIVAGCVAFVLLFLVIFVIFIKRQRKKMEKLRMYYFYQGDYKLDPDRTLLEQAGDLPYDPDWEFPEVRLTYGDSIGSGAFGQVFKAEALGITLLEPRDKSSEAVKQRQKLWRKTKTKPNRENAGEFLIDRTVVAVKTLKDNATESEYKSLALELKIMIHMGEHHNIINILGACTRGKNLKMIIEFAPYGNLLNFLRSKREIYEATWKKTRNNPDEEFTLVDLIMIAYHISCGMEYLASKKCIHRDLAARNVLIGNDYVAKIADFGLARDLYKDDSYVMTSHGKLPVKWMAPESIFDNTYTEKSDVWSFGIVLWELFTLGGTPYPGVPPAALLDFLSEGQRMPQPRDCPADMFSIMKDCWIQQADSRPHFTNIAQRIARILNQNATSGRESLYVHLKIAEETPDNYLRPCESFSAKPKRSTGACAFPNSDGRPSLKRRTSPDAHEFDISDDDLEEFLITRSPLPPLPPSYDDVVPSSPNVVGSRPRAGDDNLRNDLQRRTSDKSSDDESGICVEDAEKRQNKHEVEVEMNILGNSHHVPMHRQMETLV